MDRLLPRKSPKNSFLRTWIPFALLFLVVLFAAVKFSASIWLNSQRPQLERLLSDATGFETHIKGTMAATIFPTPGVSLGGISMEYKGSTVLAVSGFDTNFDLLPLFNHKLVPHDVEINGLWLQLPADEHGKPVFAFNPGKTSATLAGAPFGLQIQVPDSVELRNSTIVVSTSKNKELHFVKGLNLAVHPVHKRLAQSSGETRNPGKAWQLQLFLNFDEAKFNRLKMGPTRLSALFGPDSGRVKLDDVNVFDGKAKGNLDWKLGKEMPEYQVNLNLTNFDAGKSVLLFRPKSFIQGRLNMSTNLSSKGTTLDQFRANASGTVKMEGTDLDLTSTNIDELVTSIISSQQYNLIDAAAYFFIGPFGVSATKGLDVAKAIQEFSKPGTTPNKIKRIHTEWQLSNGVASAQDVALQTPRYLLALKGRVDLVKRAFDNVEIGVINSRGCAIATQKFYGPISSPSMGKTNILFSMTRPMLDALAKSAKSLADQKCNSPFYNGILINSGQDESPKPVTQPEIDKAENKPADKQQVQPGSQTPPVVAE
ncbi:MAG: AsmA family protein [Acidiferrobacterales bacterium]